MQVLVRLAGCPGASERGLDAQVAEAFANVLVARVAGAAPDIVSPKQLKRLLACAPHLSAPGPVIATLLHILDTATTTPDTAAAPDTLVMVCRCLQHVLGAAAATDAGAAASVEAAEIVPRVTRVLEIQQQRMLQASTSAAVLVHEELLALLLSSLHALASASSPRSSHSSDPSTATAAAQLTALLAAPAGRGRWPVYRLARRAMGLGLHALASSSLPALEGLVDSEVYAFWLEALAAVARGEATLGQGADGLPAAVAELHSALELLGCASRPAHPLAFQQGFVRLRLGLLAGEEGGG